MTNEFINVLINIFLEEEENKIKELLK